MSESQVEKLHRLVAEAVEARQHTCGKCGHAGSRHVFDFVATDDPNPCQFSCMDCMEKKK